MAVDQVGLGIPGHEVAARLREKLAVCDRTRRGGTAREAAPARPGSHALRSLKTKLKPTFAFVLFEFFARPLCGDPRRLGKPPAAPYLGQIGVRRAEYRVIAVDHRADVCRS